MKIPKTTKVEPYIEFRYNKNNKLKLSKSSDWWGGKNARFVSTNGDEGNTCLPKDLKSYIKAFNNKKIKEIEKEMIDLQIKLEEIKLEIENRNIEY